MSSKITLTLSSPGKFFLMVPPPFEEIALRELMEKWALHFPSAPVPKATILSGGVEVEVSLEHGFLLNQLLKIPNRILLRLGEFKCRDFPTLFKKIQKLPWRFFLHAIPEVEATCKTSRLNDTRKIEKAVKEGVEAYFRHWPPPKSARPVNATVYLRFLDDNCQVSLDTSGERLGRRGQKKFIGDAPIRENLAAAMLYAMIHVAKNKPVTLIDPMCGSGTFPLEAFGFYLPNKSRVYAYESLPIARKGLAKLSRIERHLFKKIYGRDRSEQAIEWAKANAEVVGLGPDTIHFDLDDLFSPSSGQLAEPRSVIANPPYDERLTLKDPKQFYQKILYQMVQKYYPDILSIILPHPWNEGSFEVKDYRPIKSFKFKNGGIPVTFILWQRES